MIILTIGTLSPLTVVYDCMILSVKIKTYVVAFYFCPFEDEIDSPRSESSPVENDKHKQRLDIVV